MSNYASSLTQNIVKTVDPVYSAVLLYVFMGRRILLILINGMSPFAPLVSAPGTLKKLFQRTQNVGSTIISRTRKHCIDQFIVSLL